MANNADDIERGISVKGQTMGAKSRFKYLDELFQMMAQKPEVPARIEQATAALMKPKPFWR